ncbi:Dynamin family [Nesidiocoris tenuis]|uniref:Dynamin family n=1 Tax=Nesidiocoris tenuis TaxID=355587 RepID=A0ABN7AF56_9HEMI|nr:Dynamin family [Nesidiocoris tenuis]
MFPRIVFIFFLVLSPSFGTESEGPSETECRPYIEKALQREGVAQDLGQTTDDVGEPTQIDNPAECSKEDSTSGEEQPTTSGSSGTPPDSGGNEPPDGDATPDSSIESEAVNDPASEETVPAEDNAAIGGTEEPSTESEENEEIRATEDASLEEAAAITSDETTEAESIEEQPASIENTEQPADLSVESQEGSAEGAESEVAEAAQSVEASENVGAEEISSEVPIDEEQAPLTEPPSDGIFEDPLEQAEASGESSNVEEASGQTETPETPETVAQIELGSEPAVAGESDGVPSGEQSDEVVSTDDQVAAASDEEPAVAEESTESTEDPQGLATESEPTPAEEAKEQAPTADGEPTTETNASAESSEIPQSEETEPSAEDAAPSSASIEEPASAEELTSIEQSTTSAEEAASENITASEVESGVKGESEDQQVATDSKETPQEVTLPLEEPAQPTEDAASEPELPEEELTMPIEIPSNLRSKEHLAQILKLTPGADEKETLLAKTMDNTLRELKKLYDAAIKPLEILYKYRDLSNRHFGDPEIFSKPLILFMGPWSGGKSTLINYLLDNEFKQTALRSGAEPSPAYFNIVMHGEREEVLDGTQLAADWTFSGLQKFGQGLLDRLRGLKLNHPLLQKVNIVEIPGILEIRKQVERLFPFNDACQWFIDRADIIFLVYDPSKLDVGPETEAILDQLKGREMQTRIILNKADQVKPEELMRVQGTLIWNISPLMSSTEPPVMYSTSLWSLPYESGAPARLLHAQECSFLKDLREAIDKRVENKIASARRFAVRVRNHAKMVDCYLTTYYNHKSFFGNKQKVSDDIIEHPQNYHIYEGLSTLTNISRYDLPDPDVYRDFFRLNPVYEFQQLSATCTYFRGCPINRLDVAIAYDLPELVGKYKKSVEEVLSSRK